MLAEEVLAPRGLTEAPASAAPTVDEYPTPFRVWVRSFARRVLDSAALDIRSLAVFRIAFALVVLADIWWRAADTVFFYTDDGVMTRAEAMAYNSPSVISINFLNGTWHFQILVFAMAALAAALLLVGSHTKVASSVIWIFLMSIDRRNPQVLQGGDNLLRCLSFWAMFVPLGACWSVESRKRPWPLDAAKVVSPPALFIQLQVVAMYFFSSQLKTGLPWRSDSSAVYYALSIDQLTTPFGRSLLAYPALLSALTIATMFLEKYCGLLPFVPFANPLFRLLAFLLFVTFHAGLFVTMKLGPFPFVCMAAWLLFLPAAFWNFFQRDVQPSPDDWSLSCFSEGGSKLFLAVRNGALFFFFAAVILWNVRTLNFERGIKLYPTRYNYFLELVGLDQNWGMFAPYPMNWDGWFQVFGQTVSGRTVNFTPGAKVDDPVTDDRPGRIEQMYSTERWRKYLMYLTERNSQPWRGAYVRALVNGWNGDHPQDVLRTLDVNFFNELTQAEGSSPVEKLNLWHYDRGPQ